MRIEIVTDTYAPDVNGVAMTLSRLHLGLRKLGHSVHLIHTADRSPDHDQTCLRGVQLPGYQEVRVGLPKPFRFKKEWKERQPDVVYVATESPMGASAVKSAKKLGIPVVAGFHTNFDQYLSLYRLEKFRPMMLGYLRKVHARADLNLVPSPEVRDRLADCGFNKLGVMGRGVDTELFHPGRRSENLRSSWGARPAIPVALIVGRVAAEKNLKLGMRALEQMRQRLPDLQAVIVGDGPVRAQLEQSHSWVHFAGMQSGEDLAEHYASADILLFPSETETFGNVLLEGLASGLITVSYDYAATAAHVTHESNGLTAPFTDEEAFLSATLSALDLRRWRGLRHQAREKALTLGWPEIVKRFESHLRSVMPSEQDDIATLSKKTQRKPHYRTVFLSDVHLGTPDSKAEEAAHFLKNLRCDTLVLNGDIIDGWALRRGGKWLKPHTRFIRRVLRMMEKENTRVIYLRGNHDDILERFLPLIIGGLELSKEYVHRTVNGRRYLVVHGDGFDQVSTNHRWIAHLGAVGYDWLLKFNRFYNWYRVKRGREYYSLSKAVKARVKGAVSFVGRYEEQLQEYARNRGCDGIICGHIHTPADEMVGDIHYLNSGDWVESLTAIVEDFDGKFEVIQYNDHQRFSKPERLAAEPALSATAS